MTLVASARPRRGQGPRRGRSTRSLGPLPDLATRAWRCRVSTWSSSPRRTADHTCQAVHARRCRPASMCSARNRSRRAPRMPGPWRGSRPNAAGLRLATVGLNHRFYKPISDALRSRSGEEPWGGSTPSGPRSATRPPLSSSPAGIPTLRISGGGTLADNGPHACDLIRQIVDRGRRGQGLCAAGARICPKGCETEAFALFRNHDLRRSASCIRAGTSPRVISRWKSAELRDTSRVETAPWHLLTGRLRSGRKSIRRGYFGGSSGGEGPSAGGHGCESSLVLELESFVQGLWRPAFPVPAATGWDGVQGRRDGGCRL